jgi:hypothetical protein
MRGVSGRRVGGGISARVIACVRGRVACGVRGCVVARLRRVVTGGVGRRIVRGVCAATLCVRAAGDDRQHGQRSRNCDETLCIRYHGNTHLLPGDENDPTIWFNQPRVGMQCSELFDKEFGWDCMLGKLCRLAKRCQRTSTLDAPSDPAAAIGRPNSTGIYVELYVGPVS